MEFKMELDKGFERMRAMCKKLPPEAERRVINQTLREGAKVILGDMQHRVPKDSGQLHDSLTFMRASWAKATIVYEIGANLSTKTGKPVAPHAHLVEFGTAAHTITAKKTFLADVANNTFFGKTVKHPGARPKPFARPAFDANRQILQQQSAAMWRGIQREAKRLAGK